jgi:hypothetical protein
MKSVNSQLYIEDVYPFQTLKESKKAGLTIITPFLNQTPFTV